MLHSGFRNKQIQVISVKSVPSCFSSCLTRPFLVPSLEPQTPVTQEEQARRSQQGCRYKGIPTEKYHNRSQ